MVDITDRKRAEEAIHYQDIVSNSRDMLALLDKNFVYLAANESYVKAFGKTISEVVGNTASNIRGNKQFETVIRPNAEKCLLGNEVHYENWVDFPIHGKRCMDIYYSPYYGPDNEIKGFVINGRDITERKQTEKALQKSEEKFQKAFDSSPDSITISRLRDGKIVEANASFERMLGYTRQEVIGKTSLELGIFKNPADREVLKKIMQKESRVRDFELEVYHKSGEIRTCLVSAELIDLQGETYSLATTMDITERKRAEEALQKSEEKFQKAFESGPDPISISRLADGRIVEVNASFEKVLGYTRQEVIGKTSLELGIFKDPADREVFKKILQKESRVREFELELCRKSGESFTCRFSAELIDLHGETCMLAISRDITESKRAEEALQKSEEKFEKAFISSPDAITISRLADGKFIEVNASSERMLGYTRQEVIGKTSLELGIFKDSADREVLKNILQKESRVRDIEIEFRRKSGEILTCRVSAELIDLRGETHLLAIPRDITESKRAEEKLKAKEKSLSHAQQIAHMGSWEYSFETRKAKWSDEAYSIFEFNPNEPVLYYETYLEALHPDERAYVDKIYTDSIRDMTSGEIEYRIVMKDGRIKYIRDRWENLNDDNGKPLRSFGTFLDITDRVRHETEMKERKERLKLVKDIAMEITSDMSIEEVVTNSLESIFKMHPDYRVSYGDRTEENLYKCMVSVGPSSMKNIEGTDFDMSDATEFVKALTKGPVVTNDVLSDEIVTPIRSQLEEIQVRAMINTPVTHAMGLKGLIWLDSDAPHRWTEHEIATLTEVSRYLAVAVKNAQLTEEQKKTSANLRITTERLRTEREELTQKNIALNQILEHLEKEKQKNKEQISESVESLLMPIVKKLKARGGTLRPKDISLLESSLNSIVGKEINVFRKNLTKLSPRELDICELIREGKSSKEISSVLNLSNLTIHKHRESIRTKLQLKNRSTNLSSYLRTKGSLTGAT